jgi:predicted RNA-binding Zn ribbon-like protein
MFGSDVNAANLLEPVSESRRCLLATVKNVGYALRPPMTATPALLTPLAAFAPALTHERAFLFVGERLWLDFVNSDAARALDALRDFDTLMSWLEAASLVDGERALGMRRRAREQPSGAAAALVDARRVRGALRLLAERGSGTSTAEQVRYDALGEINRVLGRSAGTRRVERRSDGTYARTFVPVGDAFAGLMIPIVESAADALILGELPRVRRCADSRCARVFYDGTKNGRRRWCDMATCGNRAKAARHRQKLRRTAD